MTDFGDFFNYLRNSVNKEKIPVDEKQLSLLGNLSPEEWRGYKNQLPPSRPASLPWERPNWPGTPPFIPSEPKGISSEDLLKRKTSPNSTMDYWKQPAFGGRFGIKMPRDQFVTLMGVLGQSIAPNSFGGRLGANLAQLGGSMYGERMRQEREEPIRSLNQRLKEMQVGRMEKEKYLPLGGGLVQDLETGELLSLEKGGTFYERDPDAWEKMTRLDAEIKGKEPGQTLEDFEKKEQIKAKYRRPLQSKTFWVYDREMGQNIRVDENEYDPSRHEYVKTIPGEQLKGLETFDDLSQIAKELKGVGNKYAGPIKGRVRAFRSQFIADPEFVKAKAKIAKLMPVVYALSGKQINEWEMKWLKEDVLPNLSSPGPNFEATLEQFIDWIDTKKESMTEGYRGAGYNLPQNKKTDPLGIR